jgi:hypothetical protein
MRIAITSNGPGEFSGWVRPLVAALLRLESQTDVTVFFVPDDYATGREADVAQRLFPSIRVVPAREYVRFALGRGRPANLGDVDIVQYLGGDLMHAARVHARLGGTARSYKFAGRAGAKRFERVYAIDERNATELAGGGYPAERIETVGNLVIDGALGEAAGAFPPTEPLADVPPDGVLFMPGARRHEVANMIPFLVQTAVQLRRIAPDVPLAFALSPFTTRDEIERALAAGGHPNVWGARGRVTALRGGIGLQPESGGPPFPVVRDAMRYAPRARLAVTLPGTKCIELAALGVPAIVCVPLNAPEVVVVNGPLQYIDRIPFVGRFVKRQVVIAVDRRFTLTAQPNIDTGEQLMPELRGTLMPAEVARRIAAYAADADALAEASRRLRALYAAHAGAADRMARSLLGAEPASQE